MKTLRWVAAALLCVAFAATATAAPKKKRTREAKPPVVVDTSPQVPPQIEQATIASGKLVVTGKTDKANQVVVLVNTGDKAVTGSARTFRFELAYLPDTCKVSVKVESLASPDFIVSLCAPRGKDGANGQDGKDGKSGGAGFAYGTLGGDGTAFKCWLSDVVGLWFIKDYPTPNSRTIAHIAPDGIAGSNKVNITEPDNPLKTEQPNGPGVTQWGEFDGSTIYILNRTTNNRLGMRGDISPDCKSILWRGAGDGNIRRWER
jgi:hypothetical protein